MFRRQCNHLRDARFTTNTFIEQSLNNRTPTAYDEVTGSKRQKRPVVNQNESLAGRERQQGLKDHFQKQVWQTLAGTQRLACDYNERVNCCASAGMPLAPDLSRHVARRI
jgi:N12 class adenine-specific DNA methylase